MKMLDTWGNEIELTPCEFPLVQYNKELKVFVRVVRISGWLLGHPMLERFESLQFVLRRNSKFVTKRSPRYQPVEPRVHRRDKPDQFLALDSGSWMVAERRTGVRVMHPSWDRKTALGVFMDQVGRQSTTHFVKKVAQAVQEWESWPNRGKTYREALTAAGFSLEPGLGFLSSRQQVALARHLLKP